MSKTADSNCPHIEGCTLYPLFSLESSLKVWQTFYCRSKFETCVRYQRSRSGEKVDAHLLPDGTSLVLATKTR